MICLLFSHQTRSFKNFAKFTGKQLCWSFLFNKNEGSWTATFLKKRLRFSCFPTNFANIEERFFYRTPVVAASAFSVSLINF